MLVANEGKQENNMSKIGQLHTIFWAVLLTAFHTTTLTAWADDCLNPLGWVPENLSELLIEHHAWATETLPPDPNDHRRINLCHADLSGMALGEVHLYHANLSITRMVDTNFNGAMLDGVKLDGSYIMNSNFEGTSLKRASFRNVEIANTRFAHAHINHVVFQDVKIKDSNFTGSHLNKAKFWRTKLTGLKMQSVDLNSAGFVDSSMENIDFTGADLSHTFFSRTKLTEVNLYFANLSRADLGNTEIQDVIFKDALLYLSNLKAINIGEEKRDHIANFCNNLTSARDWQYSYRKGKFLCGAKILPGKHKLK